MALEVLCGANRQVLDWGPDLTYTVGLIREELGPALNIDPNMIAVVGDTEVEDDHVLKTVDRLSFIKRSGSKG